MRASLFFAAAGVLLIVGCAPRPPAPEPVAYVPPPPVPQQISVPPPAPMPEYVPPPRVRSAYRHHRRHHHRVVRHYYGGSRPFLYQKRVRVHGLHGPVYKDRTTAH